MEMALASARLRRKEQNQKYVDDRYNSFKDQNSKTWILPPSSSLRPPSSHLKHDPLTAKTYSTLYPEPSIAEKIKNLNIEPKGPSFVNADYVKGLDLHYNKPHTLS